MKQLNCLIIDDEPIARRGIETYCKEISFLNIIALCKNALQANEYLHTYSIDVIFLDINMPILTGLDWLKTLQNSPSIIITTAYDQHALESFSYEVIDYLVKPISFERFLQAVNKVYRHHEKPVNKEFFFVKNDQSLKKVIIADILFVMAMQNYVKIIMAKQTITSHMTLKMIKEILPNHFIQTHKSYLVSKYSIDEVIGNQIIIKKYQIPISVRLKKDVLRRLL